MDQFFKTEDYKEQKAFLYKNKLLNPKIEPVIVQGLFKYKEVLNSRIILSIANFNYIDVLYARLKTIMEILSREHKQKSLTYVVKKCAFIHTFLHVGCRTGLCNSQDIELITTYIYQLIKIDIPKLSQPEKPDRKVTNSIQKLFNYIRGNSESKNPDKSKSKLKMENTSDKGAIKELAYKVVLPLCSYFLKISQQFLLYSNILRKKIPREQQEQIKWKIMNYLSLLCQIVAQFNRLGKYYKQDLSGCWVLIYYIMSIDITIYANIVAQSLGKACKEWHQKITLVQKFAKISKNHRGQFKKFLEDEQFSQIVKQVELFLEYKQKMLYLYCNAQIKPYLSYFQKPSVVKKQSKCTELFDLILNLASQTNFSFLNKKAEKNKDQQVFDSQKTGKVIRKRIHSHSNSALSSSSTIQSTLRDNIILDRPFQQKVHILNTKEIDTPQNSRTHNFISTVKSKAMGR